MYEVGNMRPQHHHIHALHTQQPTFTFSVLVLSTARRLVKASQPPAARTQLIGSHQQIHPYLEDGP